MCHCLHDITLSSNDVSKANQSNMMFIFDVHFLHLIGNILVVIMVFCFMNRESVTNVFIANLSFWGHLSYWICTSIPSESVHKFADYCFI